MQRRKYITAIAVVMGVSGCIDEENTTITEETAMEEFTDITKFESPNSEVVEQATRFVDDEAGVAFWAFRHQASGMGESSQLQIESKPVEETEL